MDIGQNTVEASDAGEVNQDNQNVRDVSEYKETLQQFRLQLSKDPRNVKLLNQVGQAAERVGDIDRALWAYKRAIRLDPGHAESFRNLGLLYRQEGREGPAAAALQQYIQQAGDDVELPAMPKTPSEVDGDGLEAKADPVESPILTRLATVWDEMDLTPAEAMFLLDPQNSDGLKMMQYTLLDLVARNIFRTDERLRVGRGAAYGESDLTPHEALFAKYFAHINDYIDVDKLARAALAELDDDGTVFKSLFVRRSLLRKGYLVMETKRIAGLLPIQQAVPSKRAALTRNRLQRLLKEANRHLARSLANNPQQVNAYFDQGGPAFLLMDAYPSRHFEQWHAILSRIGFGPTIDRLSKKTRQSSLGAYVEDILKLLLGS